MHNMFSTAYYRLILLPTFESAGRVAKVKQKIGSETSLKRRSGCYAQGFAGYRLSVQQWTGCDRFTVEQ
jgi:hypothetical protein